MTDRLTQLLHAEADQLDIPPVTAEGALSLGRGLRRRRTFAMAGATAAVLALVGGGIALTVGGGEDRAHEPAVSPSGDLAFAIGNDVYVDGVRARIDDTSVKSLYYTSAGVLVRHGDNPNSDGGGPQRFSLVELDGTVQPISVVTEETVHSADPTQPYLAYAETTNGSTDVVVWNVESDVEEARIPLPDGLSWGGWSAPPVSISGDYVYVGADDTARAVNWRTGEVTETDALSPGFPQVFGGRAADGDRIVDARTGDTLLESDIEESYFSLSPDGRFAKLSSEDGDGSDFAVYDVASGAHVAIEGETWDYGWSAEGSLFAVDGDELTTCSPTTGVCETSELELVKPPSDGEGEVAMCDQFGECTPVSEPDYSGELKLGGFIYES